MYDTAQYPLYNFLNDNLVPGNEVVSMRHRAELQGRLYGTLHEVYTQSSAR